MNLFDFAVYVLYVLEVFAVVFGSLFLVLLFAEIASHIQAARERRKRERLTWRRERLTWRR